MSIDQGSDAPFRTGRRALLGAAVTVASRAAKAETTIGRILVPDSRRLVVDGREIRCAIGATGARVEKREGDKASPAGIFPLREVLYRPDRVSTVRTALPCRAMRPEDGWCDEPSHPLYNRPVTLPFAASHEEMWRDDHLYDLVVIIGYNDAPPVPGRGSAIFLHVADPDYGPTLGCVSIALPALLEVVARCGSGTTIEIAPS
jgi:L,D-peptidoglycan transpeptidase YkuD (ErfK/YbiS/YcfS/YnhG family)